MDHILKATPETVHLGGFSANLPPALVVESGDRVEVETYTGFKIYDQAPPEFLTPEFVEICQTLGEERKVGPGPHLLTGPIYVQNAEPGDVLEVCLESISPRLSVGFNAIRPGWGALPEDFPDHALRFIHLNLSEQNTEFPVDSGIKIPLKPFFGILGVATEESTRSSVPPGIYGGNVDNRELQAGTRVFLPVFLPGALFSLGDGHAAQGDGEVNVTAIETSMNGTIRLILHKGVDITQPIGETATDFISMGFGETLDRAFEIALKNMIELLVKLTGIDKEDAYVLCSLAVNFHITQVVNAPQKGVHGMLPKAILPKDINWQF